MKQQNEHCKTKHYTMYEEPKPSHIRRQEAIESIPKHCWWVRQYIQGSYRTDKENRRIYARV